MSNDVRWKQRFQNFGKALGLLREPFARKLETFSDLEKEGTVKRFEIAFELGWKTLKDYLQFSGVAFEQITPRNVVKEGFASKILDDGQVWIDMLDHRNLLAHVYDESLLNETVDLIAKKFLPALEELRKFLDEK